ncbi:MAG: hypothetical protein WBM06_02550 [Pseudolabrys sp.]
MLTVIYADHASEAAPFAGFDPSQRILEQDCTRRLNVEAACGFEKQGWIRLAGSLSDSASSPSTQTSK